MPPPPQPRYAKLYPNDSIICQANYYINIAIL